MSEQTPTHRTIAAPPGLAQTDIPIEAEERTQIEAQWSAADADAERVQDAMDKRA